MKKVFLCDDQSKMPKNYRGAICECNVMYFIAFREDITDFKCPNCNTTFHTDGPRNWITKVSS